MEADFSLNAPLTHQEAVQKAQKIQSVQISDIQLRKAFLAIADLHVK
jgi:hypothetical protein